MRSLTAGDDFDAGTVSGDVMLEAIGHVQVHAKSVSGSVNMNGPLAHGGRYDFKTMSGDVTLSLPADSSFKINAKVAHGGDIISDFAITPTADTTPSRKDGASVYVERHDFDQPDCIFEHLYFDERLDHDEPDATSESVSGSAPRARSEGCRRDRPDAHVRPARSGTPQRYLRHGRCHAQSGLV